MKKVIKLSEEKLERIVNLVLEQVNLNDYEEEDFYDAYFSTFRQWIVEKLGEDIKKYPLSYLLRKYGNEFEKDMEIGDASNYDYQSYSKYRLLRSAKKLVEKGKFVLPTLNQNTKFTEKYKKLLPYFVEQAGLPDFVSVIFQEDQPNRVKVRFDVDFEKMIKSQERYVLSSHNLLDKIKRYLKNFLGVEFGNPAYGEVDMESDKTNYVGLDEWVKNVLNKKIKKEIKALLKPNPIHAIRFEVNNGKATMKIVFSDSAGFGTRSNTIREIRSYLEKEGYNPRVFEVEY
jgi:hypothetical protein